MIDVYQLAVVGEGGGVVRLAAERVGEADYDRDALGVGDDALHVAAVLFQELGLQQKVFGRVAGYGEFGEGDQIGIRIARPLDVSDDLSGVAFEVSDGWVDLRQRDSEITHG